MRVVAWFLALGVLLGGLSGCGSLGRWSASAPQATSTKAAKAAQADRLADPRAHDVVLFALGLLDTDYRYGGKNPAAGLDCSGMVSHVYQNAAGLRLAGSAADIAAQGRTVERAALQPGDLVFFNTRHQSYSHVGIYLGDDRFVHAPSSGGKVRTDSLTRGWFATRFEEARTYFD